MQQELRSRGVLKWITCNGEPSYGLVGMRERAELVGARLQVTSAVGSGTRVQVDLPAPRSRQRSTTRAE